MVSPGFRFTVMPLYPYLSTILKPSNWIGALKEGAKIIVRAYQPSEPTVGTAVVQTHHQSPTFYSPCIENEIAALYGRVLIPTINWESERFADVRRDFAEFYFDVLTRLIPVKNIKSVPFDEYLRRSNARPSVKRTLLATWQRLQSLKITEHGGLIHDEVLQACRRKAFVKTENNLNRNGYFENLKAPRLIQGATPEFICLVGPWMMAFQDYVKEHLNLSASATFSSGYDGVDLGRWAENPLPHIVENDISKFDSSVHPEFLAAERRLFRAYGMPALTSELVRCNIKTVGATMNGIYYSVMGGRKSGDPYTSLGNTLLNVALHLYVYRSWTHEDPVTVRDWRMLAQGDDNVFMSVHRIPKQYWIDGFAALGFVAEPIERESIFDTEFCSSVFMPVAEGIVLSPKPGRVLAKLGHFCQLPATVDARSAFKGNLLGLWDSVAHIPFMRQIFIDHLQDLSDVKAYMPKQRDWEIRLSRGVTTNSATNEWISRRYYGPLGKRLTRNQREVVQLVDSGCPSFTYRARGV